jgi:DNA-binding SARP family transcriptional activator
VSVDAIIDALWRDGAPDSGAHALHNQLSRLRGNLGPAAARLRRHGGGYALHLDPDELDVTVVRRLAAAIADRIRTSPTRALNDARDAVGLWRGAALGEFIDVAPLAADAVGLEELYKRLRDDLLEARLATGDTATVLDAAAEAARDPLRERTVTL